MIRCRDRVAVLRDRKKLAELTGDQTAPSPPWRGLSIRFIRFQDILWPA